MATAMELHVTNQVTKDPDAGNVAPAHERDGHLTSTTHVRRDEVAVPFDNSSVSQAVFHLRKDG